MKNHKFIKTLSLILALVMACSVCIGCSDKAASESTAVDQSENPDYIGGELNLLCWTGYEEDPIVKGFEEKYGVKVNYKIAPTSTEMYAILETAEEGEWDVCTPDTPWISKMVASDMLQPLDMTKYPEVNDFFEKWKNFEEVKVDGEQYGIVSHWGYYSIIYNTDYLTAEECSTMDILWDEKVQGKVAVYDWYLPNMNMLSIMLGNDKPAEVDEAGFEEIKQTLFSMKGQESAICATPADVIQSMANGSSWVGIAGEWLQMTLASEGYPIDIQVPETGAMSWAECISICNGAKNQEAAEAFVKYIISPEAQAKLAWADCYHAPVPNKKAADFLTDEQKEMLKVFDEEYEEYILSHLVDRQIPADEAKWEGVWTEYKTMK